MPITLSPDVATTTTTSRTCPKCGFESAPSSPDCPRCGVIIDKVEEVEARRDEARSEQESFPDDPTHRLERASELVVRQMVEKWEAITGFETKNRYRVMDATGNDLFYAAEQGDGLLAVVTRAFLKALRPFTMHVASTDGTPFLTLQSPFRFFFHKLDVIDAEGSFLGSVEWRFAIFRRLYSVKASSGAEVFSIVGPVWRPWTFNIDAPSGQRGVITKKWSDALKEMFSDADNFGISFPAGIDTRRKSLLLGAVFLIDAVHFENSN